MNDEINPFESPRNDADGEEWPSDGKLVVLATFRSPTDAHVLRNELARNGIPARVGNESSTALFGATIAGASSAFWIEVIILESDAERALEVKERWLADSGDEEGQTPEWKCSCGETVDEGFLVCWNCGGEFVSDEG